jgi:hypothetical protein
MIFIIVASLTRPLVKAKIGKHNSIKHLLHVSNTLRISYFADQSSLVLFIEDSLLINPVDLHLISLIYFFDRFVSILVVLTLFQNKYHLDVTWVLFILILFINLIKLCWVFSSRLLLTLSSKFFLFLSSKFFLFLSYTLFFYILLVGKSLNWDANEEG